MASFDEAPPGNSKSGEKIFKTKCAQYHTVEKGAGHKQGPNLNGLFGRQSGTTGGYSYSAANRSNPVARLWRPAAQKNIRNQWSKLSSYRKQWATTSSAARSHATSLVNVYLNHKYMPSVEMGVLRDMPNIKTKACQKLLKQQELHRTKILSYYKDMVAVVTQMVNISRSMRCFLKGTSSPIVQFSSSSEDKNDTGDCGDIPVFVFWSISSFEKLSEEVTEMYATEFSLKRLLVLKLLSISSEASQAPKLCWSDEFYPGEFDDLSVCNLYSEESCKPISPNLKSLESTTPVDECSNQPNREILQVYLTTWLAEVSIDTHRVEEIFTIIGEEINASLS